VRILAVTAPGGEARARALSGAVAAWNRGLDIRLRFLAIGVEEASFVLPGGAGAAEGLVAVDAAVARERPALLVLHGSGPGALAAAISAARSAVPVLRTGSGERGGPTEEEDRAVDRLATVRCADGPAALENLRAEGLGEGSLVAGDPADPAAVERALQALLRALRAN
jgi:hypothetical protein